MENRDLGEAFWGMMRDAMMTKETNSSLTIPYIYIYIYKLWGFNFLVGF